ncbi:MAG: signal peptide peptidase SppA [Deltaproteobacteria bacterium]|nr:signal peptide peptidase SppA [Deltaproteobacteria bacterium]
MPPGARSARRRKFTANSSRTRAVKPVVASLGGTAASGGYYIACAANLIVANPGTLTGSIGAIMEFFNLRGLYQWAGVETDTVKSGPYKDMGNFARGLTGEEKQLLGDVIADVRDQFVDAIAEGRGMPAEQIMPIADGRIFTGQQAKELGLVDRLGNFNDAVAAAAELGGISGEPHLIRFRDKKTDILDLMLDDLIGRLMNTLENRLRDHGPRALPRLNYR